jgi:hypothetical protein
MQEDNVSDRDLQDEQMNSGMNTMCPGRIGLQRWQAETHFGKCDD